MTPAQRLNEIAGRVAKTTPGEWFDDNGYRVRVGSVVGGCLLETKHFEASVGFDCEFIAHSKSDITWLLEEVRVLREALKPFADMLNKSKTEQPTEHDYWVAKSALERNEDNE